MTGKSGFQPENIDEVYTRIKETQHQARRALVKFKHEQCPAEIALIKVMALCNFLKGTNAEKALLTEIRAEQNLTNVPLVEGDHTEQVNHKPVIPEVPVDSQRGGEDIVNTEVTEDPPVIHFAESARVIRDLSHRGFNTGTPN